MGLGSVLYLALAVPTALAYGLNVTSGEWVLVIADLLAPSFLPQTFSEVRFHRRETRSRKRANKSGGDREPSKKVEW